MAAALDQYPTKVTGAEVAAARGNPSAELMAAWLQSRLKVPVELRNSRGPGVTAVRLFTPSGPIALTRPDGAIATFSVPGQPDRPVALKRRTTSELLSEELRRLDPDDVYAKTLACMVERDKLPADAKTVDATARKSTAASVTAAGKSVVAKKAPVKKALAKKTGAKKTVAKKTAAKKTVAKKTAARKVAGGKKVAKR
jgi:hypothetical protein